MSSSAAAAADVRSLPGTMLGKAGLDTNNDIILNPTTKLTTVATQLYITAAGTNEEKYIAIEGGTMRQKADARDAIVNDVSDVPLPKECLIYLLSHILAISKRSLTHFGIQAKGSPRLKDSGFRSCSLRRA